MHYIFGCCLLTLKYWWWQKKMEQNFSCEVCGIRCSGIEPYIQHMSSYKHKKKEEQRKLAETAISDEKSFHCHICGIICTGIVPYQQHKMSDKHLKKEQAKQFSEKNLFLAPSNVPCSMDCDVKDSSSTLNSSLLCSETDECNVSSSEVINHREGCTAFHVQNNFKCSDCDKQFTGFVPYEQHMNSIVHKKKLHKIMLQSALESGETGCDVPMDKQACSTTSFSPTENLDNLTHMETLYRCKFCEKDFPSQEIRDMHMLSSVHSEQKAFPSMNGYCCAVCNKTFTGSIPFRQHMISSVHQKNVKKSELFANLSSMPGGKFSEANMNSSDAKNVIQNTLGKSVENSSLTVLALSNFHDIGSIDDNNLVLAECYVCKLKFYNNEEIREHYESESHYDNQNIYEYKKKVRVFGPEDPFDLAA